MKLTKTLEKIVEIEEHVLCFIGNFAQHLKMAETSFQMTGKWVKSLSGVGNYF